MSWTTTLNYPGHLTDIVGQIVGPNAHKEYYVIEHVELEEGALVDGEVQRWTVAHLELMTSEIRANLPAEAQQIFAVTRAASIAEKVGHNILEGQLPPAFRQGLAPGALQLTGALG
jgi:hypothetical protein